MADVDELRAAVARGERRALAKAITLAESSLSADRAKIQLLLSELAGERSSLRLGITGSPGVGKSTFIDALGSHLVAQGLRPAVLAYDPAGRSGGSILGDKTRMQALVRAGAAFVRPSSNRGALGGVGPATLESIRLCEVAGFDPVIVETVGVGQSEVSVADLVDIVLLLVLPNAGDELQGIKKGVLEYADLVLINKADGEQRALAERALSHYQTALSLLAGARSAGSTRQVMALSALEGRGVPESWQEVSQLYTAALGSGSLLEQRGRKLVALFRRQLLEALGRRLLGGQELGALMASVEARLKGSELSLEAALSEVLERALESLP